MLSRAFGFLSNQLRDHDLGRHGEIFFSLIWADFNVSVQTLVAKWNDSEDVFGYWNRISLHFFLKLDEKFYNLKHQSFFFQLIFGSSFFWTWFHAFLLVWIMLVVCGWSKWSSFPSFNIPFEMIVNGSALTFYLRIFCNIYYVAYFRSWSLTICSRNRCFFYFFI